MVTRDMVLASVRALMTQVIDYAGLYPPANLSLEEALHNYVEYQSDPNAWMLSRFVVPAGRLTEVTELAAKEFPTAGTLKFSALGRGGNSEAEFLENLTLDVNAIELFRNAHGPRVRVDVYETLLPSAAIPDRAAIIELLRECSAPVFQAALTPFFEAPVKDGWDTHARDLLVALYEQKSGGFKLRTGGIVPEKFPSPRHVAAAISGAVLAGIPMKFTAGLHHPLRHYDESVQAKMHGFINVFTAGVMSLIHYDRITAAQLDAILEDEDASHFRFDETGLAWGDFLVTPGELETARQHNLISFGSCSFIEPRDDLRPLGLLPQ